MSLGHRIHRKHFLKSLAGVGLGTFVFSRLSAKQETVSPLASPIAVKRDPRVRAPSNHSE